MSTMVQPDPQNVLRTIIFRLTYGAQRVSELQSLKRCPKQSSQTCDHDSTEDWYGVTPAAHDAVGEDQEWVK